MLSLATPGGRCGGREVQTAARQSQTHKETQLSQLDETAKKEWQFHLQPVWLRWVCVCLASFCDQPQTTCYLVSAIASQPVSHYIIPPPVSFAD